MIWFAVWGVLVVLAALLLGRLAWTVVRKGIAVMAEVGKAGERASAIAQEVERLGESREQGEIAVFADPQALRRGRRGQQRRSGRQGSRHRVRTGTRASRA